MSATPRPLCPNPEDCCRALSLVWDALCPQAIRPGKHVAEHVTELKAAHDALLAALKTLAADYDALIGDGVTESNQPEVLRNARAAIALAEAREP